MRHVLVRTRMATVGAAAVLVLSACQHGAGAVPAASADGGATSISSSTTTSSPLSTATGPATTATLNSAAAVALPAGPATGVLPAVSDLPTPQGMTWQRSSDTSRTACFGELQPAFPRDVAFATRRFQSSLAADLTASATRTSTVDEASQSIAKAAAGFEACVARSRETQSLYEKPEAAPVPGADEGFVRSVRVSCDNWKSAGGCGIDTKILGAARVDRTVMFLNIGSLGSVKLDDAAALMEQMVREAREAKATACGRVQIAETEQPLVVVRGTVTCDQAAEVVAAFDRQQKPSRLFKHNGWVCATGRMTDPYAFSCGKGDRSGRSLQTAETFFIVEHAPR